MSFEDVINIANQLKQHGVKAISLNGGGNPTSHKRFGDIVNALCDLGFVVGALSNGDGILGNLSACKRLSWLRISIESFDKNTYEKLHRSSMPDFKSMIKKLLANNVNVSAGCLVQPENAKEMIDIAKQAKELQVSSLRFNFLWNPFRHIAIDESVVDNSISYIRDSIMDHSFKVTFSDERLKYHKSYRFFTQCYYCNLSCVISPEGYVYRCCTLNNTIGGNIGLLHKDCFSDIWNNRDKAVNTKACPDCLMDGKNNYIHELLRLKQSDDLYFL